MPVEMELNGPPGSGKRTLAAQLCAKLGPAGRDLLVVDTQMLLGGETTSAVVTDRLFHAVRAARLEGAVLYWNQPRALWSNPNEVITLKDAKGAVQATMQVGASATAASP